MPMIVPVESYIDRSGDNAINAAIMKVAVARRNYFSKHEHRRYFNAVCVSFRGSAGFSYRVGNALRARILHFLCFIPRANFWGFWEFVATPHAFVFCCLGILRTNFSPAVSPCWSFPRRFGWENRPHSETTEPSNDVSCSSVGDSSVFFLTGTCFLIACLGVC